MLVDLNHAPAAVLAGGAAGEGRHPNDGPGGALPQGEIS